jgi:short-subunit dehydrogenase
MEDRSVLITGAGSGIGRQLVLDGSRRGWKIAGIDQNQHALIGVEKELRGTQRQFAWAEADVTQASTLTAQVGKLEEQLGPIDLLIACAGVAGETPAVGMDPKAINRIIEVNLIGVSNTIAAVLPGMLQRRRGHLAAISSLASYRGLPAQMGYCASKAGLNTLMQSLWLDVKHHGLFVTTICPGHTRTPQAVGSYKDEYLMPVEKAATEILKAIDKRKRFHAFPRYCQAELVLLKLLPTWLQEWLLVRRLEKVKEEQALTIKPAAVCDRANSA